MNPTDSCASDGLSGLKPQLQSWPLSLEMVSVLLPVALPPPLPLPLPEPELVDWEPAVHPAAITPAATMTPYLMRRLMPFRPYCRLIPDRARSPRGCAPRRRLSPCGAAVALERRLLFGLLFLLSGVIRDHPFR